MVLTDQEHIAMGVSVSMNVLDQNMTNNSILAFLLCLKGISYSQCEMISASIRQDSNF